MNDHETYPYSFSYSQNKKKICKHFISPGKAEKQSPLFCFGMYEQN